MPLFVTSLFPGTGLAGLLVAGIMNWRPSTMDSGINSLTAVVVYDWLGGRRLSVSAAADCAWPLVCASSDPLSRRAAVGEQRDRHPPS